MPLPYIKIGDDVIDNALLVSVEVVQELNQHWRCSIVCRQTEDERIGVEDLLGKTIAIKTLDEQGAEHIHFNGFIHDVGLNYEVYGSYTAELQGISSSYLMDISRHMQYYSDQTLSSIANTMAGRAGLSVSVSTPGRKALNYVQYGETDFSFLNRLVDDYGGWMRPKEGGLEIFNSFQSGSSVLWRGEGGLVDFHLRGAMAPSNFKGSHYDIHAMQAQAFPSVNAAPEFYGSASRLTNAVQKASKLMPTSYEPQRARAMTVDNYMEQLEDESKRSVGASVTGRGHSRNQNLKAGDTVEIEGSLDAKGIYGLIKVEHRWEPRGYVNSFVCTPWKSYRNPNPPSMQVWGGIVPACVVDHNDPKKMGRIKVQFFWQEDGSTHWVRMTQPHTGQGRGFMWMPEVGDEVAVAFEDGDPERPVVIGCLWNGVDTAPRGEFWGSELSDNNVKRIVTKSGNRMQFVDTPEKESIVLATPNKLRISLIEKTNEHGRSTIVLHSEDGDILLSAPNGQVHIHSKYFTKETN